MMSSGFYISKLAVTGLQRPLAKIVLKPGLNVISGPSNTGKSYIFACINFMLGGGDAPKFIPESAGYNMVYLEIKTFSGKTYTLRRSISGGKFLVKEVPAESFETSGVATTLNEQHSPYDKNNISDFLLEISGFHDKEVRLNANNSKRDLSYRDIANLTLIDESKIIVERSPVYSSGQYNYQSSEQFILQLLLTGIDASELKEIEDVKVSKGKIQGKIEFVNKLIQEAQDKIAQLSSPDRQEKIVHYSARLEQLSAVLIDTSKQLEELKIEQQRYFGEITRLESDELLSRELNHRFLLLKEQYDSDLNRLTFLIEGDSYLNQLVTVSCPLCGNNLDKEHLECFENNLSTDESILEAIQIECQKIKLKKADLESTIANSLSESELRLQQLRLKKAEFDRINGIIKENLEPVRSASKEEIESIFGQQALIKELELSDQNLKKYLLLKEALEVELNSQSKSGKTVYDSLSISKIQDLCDEIATVLSGWNYASSVTVTLNQAYKIYDFIVNGVDRKSNGKGIRAIIYSAFIFGLMRYCIKQNLPHPRSIILDSPLTTYHGEDIPLNDEDAPLSLQNAFFKDLSNLSQDRQVIILDNKQPDESIISKINYIRFTKNPNSGRAGFFQL